MKFKETLIEKMTNRFIMGFRKVYAEEKTDTPEQPDGESPKEPTVEPTQPSSIDFESLIAKARKEEKEKLYPEITKLKDELEKKVGRINELLLTIGEKDEALSDKEKAFKELEKGSNKSESQEVKDLQLKITELENSVSTKDSEIESIKLDSYRKSKIAEAGGELIPELVIGSSEEEIDLALERAKERYVEIVSNIAPPAQPKPKDSNNIPLANPKTESFNAQLSTQNLADIDLMTPTGRKEYQELRKQMGLK